MKNCKKQADRGSITVEAAFVMPVILMVIFLAMLLAFYIHNRAWYTAAASETVLTAATAGVRKGAVTEQILTEKMEERMQKQGFPIRNLSVSTKAQTDRVSVSAEAAAGRTLGGGGWKFRVEETVQIIKPVTFIRKLQGISALTEE